MRQPGGDRLALGVRQRAGDQVGADAVGTLGGGDRGGGQTAALLLGGQAVFLDLVAAAEEGGLVQGGQQRSVSGGVNAGQGAQQAATRVTQAGE